MAAPSKPLPAAPLKPLEAKYLFKQYKSGDKAEIEIEVTGGVSPYNFIKKGEKTGKLIDKPGKSILEVPIGITEFIITDKNNKPFPLKVSIELPKLESTITVIEELDGKGKIKVEIKGGTPPYLYSCGGVKKDYKEGQDNILEVTAGKNKITISDSTKVSFGSKKNEKTEYCVIAVPILEVKKNLAIQYSNGKGKVELEASGGIPPIYYAYKGKKLVYDKNGNNSLDLDIGEQIITFSDSSKPVQKDNLVVKVSKPLPFTLEAKLKSKMCFVEADPKIGGPLTFKKEGSIAHVEFQVKDGTPPFYQNKIDPSNELIPPSKLKPYHWINCDLNAGVNEFLFLDSYDNKEKKTIKVEETPELILKCKVITEIKDAGGDARVEIKAEGGKGPYKFAMGIQSLSEFSGTDLLMLKAGKYDFRLEDKYGNMAFASLELLEPSQKTIIKKIKEHIAKKTKRAAKQVGIVSSPCGSTKPQPTRTEVKNKDVICKIIAPTVTVKYANPDVKGVKNSKLAQSDEVDATETETIQTLSILKDASGKVTNSPPIFEILAGSKNELVKVNLDLMDAGVCENHKGRIYDIWESNEGEIVRNIKSDNKTLELYLGHPPLISLHKNILNKIKNSNGPRDFWAKLKEKIEPKEVKISYDKCTPDSPNGFHPITFKIYPKVSWEVDLSLGVEKAQNDSEETESFLGGLELTFNRTEDGKVYDFSKDLLDVVKKMFGEPLGGVTKWGTDFFLGNAFTPDWITLPVISLKAEGGYEMTKVKPNLAIVDHRITKVDRYARWSFNADPLIGLNFTFSILTAVLNGFGVGWVMEIPKYLKAATGGAVDYKVDIEAFANGEVGLKVEGELLKADALKVDLDSLINAKIGVTGKVVIGLRIYARIKLEVLIVKCNAGASAEGAAGIIIEITSEVEKPTAVNPQPNNPPPKGKRTWEPPSLVFTGLTITLVAWGHIGFGKIKSSREKISEEIDEGKEEDAKTKKFKREYRLIDKHKFFPK